MAVAAALQRIDKTRRTVRRVVRLTFTGDYANTGTTGDLVDFTAMTNPNNLERSRPPRIPVGNQYAIRHANVPGFVVVLSIGTTMAAAFGVRFFQSDDAVDPLDEIANGAYAAAITGGFVDIEISLPW